jgi:hypothetical protein
VILACAVLLSAVSPAHGQAQSAAANRKKALELFDRGKVQYDLGRWTEAVELWKKAYETFTAPEFLFNIAQAYRHDGNCEQALFFYRRYLATRTKAPNRSEVEGHIAQLEKKCKARPEDEEGGATGPPGEGEGEEAEPADQPGEDAGEEPGAEAGERPARVAEADQREGEGEGVDAAQERGELEERAAPEDDRPRLFALRVAGGPSFPSLGPLDVGTLVSLTAGVGHPVQVGTVVLEPGVLVTYSPVPWEVEATDESGTAGLTGVMANLGASLEFIPKLSGRVDAGVGALIFTGLTKEGNPFLDMNDFADGAIAMFHVRGALGLEYAISRNFVLHAEPVVFSYSPSRPLREEIDSITRFEMLVGAGYRM